MTKFFFVLVSLSSASALAEPFAYNCAREGIKLGWPYEVVGEVCAGATSADPFNCARDGINAGWPYDLVKKVCKPVPPLCRQ